MKYNTWQQRFGGCPEGKIIRKKIIEGEWGDVGVFLIKTEDGDYCVYVEYAENYQPPLGDEYFYTRDIRRAKEEFEEAVYNVQEWVENYDDLMRIKYGGEQ